MSAQRQQHDFDHYDSQDNIQANQEEPKYQEFYEIDTQSAKLRELLFFVRISLFCVSAVLLTFLFLTLGLGTITSFALAILLGIAITSTISTFILSMKK
ncbi:DUF3270 family protein [Streptococcus dentapri]|uniref:DUF3270 family protein n=1 Tax=Streptococcus dentapri TaxID=573564 RepID=A0ABV8D2Q0_9STRE